MIPEFKYGGEMLRPERDSYSYTPPWGVNKSNIAGTLSRLNRANFGSPATVTCSVILNNPSMLQFWDDFYEFTLAQGSKRFKMELFVNGVIQAHVCQIVAVPKVKTIGWHGTVSLTLEAVPIVDRCASAIRQEMMQCYGDKTSTVVFGLIEYAESLNGMWE